MRALRWLLPALLLALHAAPALALDAIVDKRVARLRGFAFESGETVPVLELGVETYGTLAPTRDNVVVIGTYFAGDSHAAGKYDPGDAEAGWWDPLIGPGKAIDTDRWFVVVTDLISSMQVKSPTVVTSGPATTDPATGERWGLDFPEVTVRDQVRAQKAVLDALGVTHARAVIGPSLGGMLAWQWAVDYPSSVDVIVPAAAPPTFEASDRQGFRSSEAAIKADPYWLFGDYADYGVSPDYGVAWALNGLRAIVSGRVSAFFRTLPTQLREAREYDANHYLRLLDMHAEYGLDEDFGSLAAAFARIRARVVLIGFEDDDFIEPDEVRAWGDALTAAGVRNRVAVVPGGHGHLSVLEDPSDFDDVLEDALEGRP